MLLALNVYSRLLKALITPYWFIGDTALMVPQTAVSSQGTKPFCRHILPGHREFWPIPRHLRSLYRWALPGANTISRPQTLPTSHYNRDWLIRENCIWATSTTRLVCSRAWKHVSPELRETTNHTVIWQQKNLNRFCMYMLIQHFAIFSCSKNNFVLFSKYTVIQDLEQ